MADSAKAMTKGQIVAAIAEKTGLTKKQVDEVLAAQADLAYAQAAVGFTIPGIGKLAVIERAARSDAANSVRLRAGTSLPASFCAASVANQRARPPGG